MAEKYIVKKNNPYITGILFLTPAFAVFGIFQWYPILYNIILGFQNYIPGMKPEWVGLQNYINVLTDFQLPQAAKNTMLYVVLALILGYFLPVIAAVMIGEIRRGRGFFRLAIYFPHVIPGIALYIIWRWIFEPSPAGLLNQVIGLLGFDPNQQWLLDPKTVMVCLVMMSTWANFGGTAILYMASISSINPELYEAAELDGTSIWQRIIHITLPSIRPTMHLLLITQIISTFQVLQEPFVMTGGGPAGASNTLMYIVYNYAFVDGDFGKAGALGTLLFMVLLGLSILYVKKSGLADAGENY